MHDVRKQDQDLEFRMLEAVQKYTAIGKVAAEIPSFPVLRLVPRLHREALTLDNDGKMSEAVPLIEKAVNIFAAIVRAFERNPDRSFRLTD